MASTVPAKSQPLHNFPLQHLAWKKDGHSQKHDHHRYRSIIAKSPSRRDHASSAYQLQGQAHHSPLRDSMPIPPMPPQSSLCDSGKSPRRSPIHGESYKQSAILESVKQSQNRSDSVKQSRLRGDLVKQYALRCDSVKQSDLRSDTVRRSPMGNLASETETSMKNKAPLIEYRRNYSRTSEPTKNGVYSRKSDKVLKKSEKKSRAVEADAAVNEDKSANILIKNPYKSKPEEENPKDEVQKIDNNTNNEEFNEEGKANNDNDDEPKTWNLRPRRPSKKSLNANGGAGKNNGSGLQDKKDQSPSGSLNDRSGDNESNGGGSAEKKKRKLKFSIELSKEEIQEDIFIMTGSMPARRPKKRMKTIQKQLDNLFPGLWLASITPNSYKVYENQPKG